MSVVDHRTRLLYVTAAFPFPLSSGYLRHHHLLRELAPHHRVHLMSLVGPGFDEADRHGVADIVGRVSTFRRSGDAGLGRAVRLLDPGRPDGAGRDLVAAVEWELAAGRVDAVLLSGKETAAVADVVAGRAPLVVDLCDATSSRLTQELALAGPARRLALAVRRSRIRAIERHLVEVADRLVVASARDASALRAEGAPARVGEAVVIPNGIDLDFWHRRTSRLGRHVVFCGNLGYGPNADAARRLVHDVLPRIRAVRPDVEAIVVGTGASPALVAALEQPGVTLTGPVADVRPHLERGAVFVAPLRIASGIQNKLLEALALELPVVTTEVAAAGLRSHDGAAPVVVADTDEDLARATLERLDAAAADRWHPDREGRRWVAEHFRWGCSGDALAAVLAAAGAPEVASW